MCGIVGYIGKESAFPILIPGLKRVLYRGYDSFGFAVIDKKNNINLFKTPGRLDEWEKRLSKMNFEGNIGIAHCLTSDTLVQLADGRIVEISKIKNGEEVLSLNPRNLKLVKGRAKVFKHKSPEYLYEIRTSSASLKVTGQHKMLVFSDKKIKEKKVKDLSKNDFLIFPKTIKVKGKKIKFKEIFAKRYYKITNEISQLIKNKLDEKELSMVRAASEIGVSDSYIEHIARNDRNFREDQLQKILPFFSIKLSQEHFRPVNTIHGKFINLPKESSPELMQILGYFLGDGTAQPKTLRFKDTDREVLKEYQKLIEKVFNIKGKIIPQKGTTAYLLEVNSVFLSKWFKKNIVLRKKEFLGEVGSLPKKEVATFLRGLFDAEGSISLASRQVNLRLTDKDIVKTAQFLLLRFGITSSFCIEKKKPENWNDSFGIFLNRYLFFEEFADKINFSSNDKFRKLNLLISKRKRPIFREDQKNDVISQPILEIKKIKSDTENLYDLEVTPYSNFFANGFLSHNSRWASHGGVTEANAHPHWDCKRNIHLVHNGIIENYRELKEQLIKEGHKFNSETDTEVLVHLIEKFFKGNLEQATIKALALVRGTYGIAVICKEDPKKIVAARFSSPLLLGLGENEFLVASDPSAIIAQTKKVVYLNDGEVAVLKPDGFFITDLSQKQIEKTIKEIDWDLEMAQKSGYAHFMLKEIMEEPQAIENAVRGRLIAEEGRVKLGGLDTIQQRLRKVKRIILVACGTASYAARVGEYMLEEYAGIPAEVDIGSEFRYRKPVLDENTAAIFVSQSGETADTLAALREMKEKGVLTIGVTNVVGSTQPRETEAGIYTRSGPEIAVASTKAFLGQLATLAMITVYLGRQREMTLVTGRRIISEINSLPVLAGEVLSSAAKIEELAKKYKDYKNFWFIGRKYNFPIALEGALKLKEISYLHAEGVAGGELKHGPLALVDKDFPTIAICPLDSVYEKMISNIQEIKAREGKVIALTTKGNQEIEKIVDDVIYIPKTLEMLTPLLSVIPLHLFAYHMSILKGKDPDYPRNLAKAVSIE